VDKTQAQQKAQLDAAISHIEKNFGKGAIMRLGDKEHVDIEVVPTGALPLDLALGIGGMPKGRIAEIYGPESSGKTTLVYHLISESQKRGGVCAFIDTEHAFDPVYAKRIGVDVDNLLISQPDHGEQALEICELLIRSGSTSAASRPSRRARRPWVTASA
jgi:recombination protein RecA